MRRKSVSHNQILFTLAGILAGFLTLAQLNLQEVLRWDRLQHTSVTMALFLGFFMISVQQKKLSFFWPALAALSIGFMKEYGDPQFQNFDIVANFFGLILGVLSVFAFNAINSGEGTRTYKRKVL